ncbi:magnesium transporter MgtE N-terminal domain-containing protein [Endozoicomonas numazuensis]|uniref:AAA+ ATPase domain-containing protein n=1 Tax=Endozoicomonas numazuensis TaxID=1137799 RepID=A0A081NCT2_9GAMM|nr:hypothetical protein [Endozoicomonas numazuensis]KEQ16255.1 hypothetical protein GZ78_23870 [Endozoicomonas numazuensis]
MAKVTDFMGVLSQVASEPSVGKEGPRAESVRFQLLDIIPVIGTARKKRREEARLLSDFVVVVVDDKGIDTFKGHTKSTSGAYFVKNDEERQAVLRHYRSSQPRGSVVHITKPGDFDKDDLIRTVTCDPKKGLETSAGRLYEDEPMTLVIDFQKLTPVQMASLNELFDDPPRYQGRILGPNITVSAFVNESMLESSPYNPGPDFWRRVDDLGVRDLTGIDQKLILNDHDELNVDDLDDNEEGFADASDVSETYLDLNFHDAAGSWHAYLFGGIHISPSGSVEFKEGVLDGLPEDAAYRNLVNAPWDDPAFERALATAYREKGFWANGKWVSLPKTLKFSRSVTHFEKINERLDKLTPGVEGQPYVCVNEQYFDRLTSDVSLAKGELKHCDTFASLVQDKLPCTVMVTSSLEEFQWVQLLKRLESLNPKPSLTICKGCDLPDALSLSRFVRPVQVEPPELKAGADNVFEDNVFEDNVFEYVITSKTDPNTLLATTPMGSQKGMSFREVFSPLMQAIQQGKAIRLMGLETNPEVALFLETLITRPPYIYLNGRRIDVPDLQLECPMPGKAQLPGLWSSVVSKDSTLESVNASQLAEQVAEETGCSQESLKKVIDILHLMKSIPRSRHREFPDNLPAVNKAFLEKVVSEVERERKSDCSPIATNYHWQKALNDLLAKEYRLVPNVYGFVKTAIGEHYGQGGPKRVDVHGVRSWLEKHPRVRSQDLKESYWELARYFSPGCLPSAESYGTNFSSEMAKELIQLVPASQQRVLSRHLGCRMTERPPLLSYDGDLQGRIYNALLAAGLEKRVDKTTPVHIQAAQLACELSQKGVMGHPEQMTELLKIYFEPALLEVDFNDLCDSLIQRRDSQFRQKRRVARILERLETNPMIMIKGEAGTGKTFTAQAVAKAFASRYTDASEPIVASLSPEHKQEDLFGSDVLVAKPVVITRDKLKFSAASSTLWAALCQVTKTPEQSDSVQITFDRDKIKALNKILVPLGLEDECAELVSQLQDNEMKFSDGPIMKWARMRNPPVLILDEANLVKAGVLQPLIGLSRKPPVLNILGQVIELTDKHRVIMTGNPENYDGRMIDPEMRKHVLPMFFRQINHSVLTESIIRPGLPKAWPSQLLDHAVATTARLYDHYQRVLPAHTFGPRDIKDIIARIRGFCPEGTAPSEQALNAIIWESMAQCLEGEVGKKQAREARALKHWYMKNYNCDFSPVEQKAETFNAFYQQMKESHRGGQFDFDAPSVKSLAMKVWQELEKTGGKRATIIEGEAGRGKDALLDILLPFWMVSKGEDPAFERINASPENWDELKEMTQRAMNKGSKLVISELNTLPSRYLEGLFNEILGGEPTPGFKLLATINPSTYSGREKMSEAMASRCVKVEIDGFTLSELEGILSRRFKAKKTLTDWLVGEHFKLASQLEKQGSSVRLPLKKLIKSAKKLHTLEKEHWQDVFDDQYRLAHMALKSHQAAATPAASVPTSGRSDREIEVCRYLNEKRAQPITVILDGPGASAVYLSNRSVLVLPDLGRVQDLKILADKTLQTYDQEMTIRSGLGELEEGGIKDPWKPESDTSDPVVVEDEEATLVPVELAKVKDMSGSSVDAPQKINPSKEQKQPPSVVSRMDEVTPGEQQEAEEKKDRFSMLGLATSRLPRSEMVSAIMGAGSGLMASVMKMSGSKELSELLNEFMPVVETGMKMASDPAFMSSVWEHTSAKVKRQIVANNPHAAETLKELPFQETLPALKSVAMDHVSEALLKDAPEDELQALINRHLPKTGGEPDLALNPDNLQKALLTAKDGEWSKLLRDVPESRRMQLLSKAEDGELNQLLAKVPVESQSWMMSEVGPDLMQAVLAEVPKQLVEARLGSLSDEELAEAIKHIPEENMAGMIQRMSSDALAAAIESLPTEDVNAIVENVKLSSVAEALAKLSPGALEQALAEVPEAHRESIIGQIPRDSLPDHLKAAHGQTWTEYFQSMKTGVKNMLTDMAGNVSSDVWIEKGRSESDKKRNVAKAFRKGLPKDVRTPLINEFIKHLDDKLDLDLDVKDDFAIPELGYVHQPIRYALEHKAEGELSKKEDEQLVRLVDLFCKNATRPIHVVEKDKKKVDLEVLKKKRSEAFSTLGYQLLNSFHILQEGHNKLSKEAYCSMLGKMLFDYQAFEPSAVIAQLPMLLGHPDYGRKAEEAMNDYYQKQLVRRDIPSTIDRVRSRNQLLEGHTFKVPYLEKLMSSRGIDSEWKWDPAAGKLDIPRLARVAAPFEGKGDATEKNTVILPVNPKKLLTLAKEELKKCPRVNKQRKINREAANHVVGCLEKALYDYRDKADWALVQPIPLTRNLNSSKIFNSLDTGIYKMEDMGYFVRDCNNTVVINCPTVTAAARGSGFQYSFDPARIMQSLGEPNAVYLDDDKLRRCIQDLLKHLPEELFNRIYET